MGGPGNGEGTSGRSPVPGASPVPDAPGLLTAAHDGVGWLVFDNPARHNALTPEMARGLPTALAALGRRDDVRVVVVRGAGDGAFMSGADIDRLGRGPDERRDPFGDSLSSAFDGLRQPVIAMVQGWCLGAGLLIAMAADIRVAADDATFGIPAARLGVGYPLPAAQLLISLVGPAVAAEILVTGDRLTAARAQQVGLVNHVVPKAELAGTVDRLAATIVDNAPLTVRASVATIRTLQGRAGAPGVATAQRLIDACLDSEDFVEGRRAFAEKRRPRFAGR